MSSSCRNPMAVSCSGEVRAWAARAVSIIALAASGGAQAVDWYFAPFVVGGAEYNTNRELLLSTQDEESSDGYSGELGAIMGFRNPRSTLDVRPRLGIVEYPDRDDLNRDEQFLDLKYDFLTPRSRTDVVAKYEKRDTYTAELPDAEFDPFDPRDPITAETGRVLSRDERTRVQLRPSFEYNMTPVTSVGTSLLYQDVEYDQSLGIAQRDYQFGYGQLFLRRTLDPRTDLTGGVYASTYEPEDLNGVEEKTDAYGATLAWTRRWSEVFETDVTLLVERSETELSLGVAPDASTDWGVDLYASRKLERSRIIVSGGRTFSPTGGGKTVTDQLRVQYIHDFTQRLSGSIAGRGIRTRAQFENDRGNDRDYARADLSLRWAATRTWFIEGGYEYIWQEYLAEPAGAENHMLFVKVGYEGLLPQNELLP